MNFRDLLTSKELAGALKRHPSYVYAMRARGFRMRGGLATINQALAYLARNPHPRSRNHAAHAATPRHPG